MSEEEYYASLQRPTPEDVPLLSLDLTGGSYKDFTSFFDALNRSRGLMLSSFYDALISAAGIYCLHGVLENEQANGRIMFYRDGVHAVIGIDEFRKRALEVLSMVKNDQQLSADQCWQLGQ